MKTLVSWLCASLLCIASLSSETLRDRLQQAEVGEFVVLAFDKRLVFADVVETQSDVLTLEEISAPLSMPVPPKGGWRAWIAGGAPQHTSWTRTRISLATGAIQSIYSLDTKEFLAQDTQNFLPTLLALPFQRIDTSERRRVGPAPMAGELDLRRLWAPKIMFEGQEITTKVDVVRVTWPKDGSELSGKVLDLYFPHAPALAFFPYWIEGYGPFSKFKVRVIDSGRLPVIHSSPSA